MNERAALAATEAAGMRLRLLPEPDRARVECKTCGAGFEVVISKWAGLDAEERGCVRCAADRWQQIGAPAARVVEKVKERRNG